MIKKMSKKYKIISQFVKDLSSETKDLETYIHVQDIISRYHLNIEINSKPLKNQMIEIDTLLRFRDSENTNFKSFFELTYTTVIKINEETNNKDELQKIVLCDVQEEIFPNLKNIFLNLIHNCGYKNVTFDKEVDFRNLYNEKINQK